MKYLFKGDATDNKRQYAILRENGYYYLKKILKVYMLKGIYVLVCELQASGDDRVFESELHLFEEHRVRLAGIYGELQRTNHTFTEVVNKAIVETQQIPFQVKIYKCKNGKNEYVNPHWVHEIPKQGARA